MRDIICTVSQKTNVNESYGTRSTTVCDVVIEMENGMVITLPIRSKLTTDKETGEQSITTTVETRIKNYGDIVLKFPNEQEENAFRKEIMAHAKLWLSYKSLEAKAEERLTSEAAEGQETGKLVKKLPPKDVKNITVPTSVSTVKVPAPEAPKPTAPAAK